MNRVLFISRVSLGHGGGGGMEFGFHALANSLKNAGYEVSILTTPGLIRQDLMTVFDRVWCIPKGRPGKYSISWWLGTFRHISLREWKPNIIISVSSAGAAAMLGDSHALHIAQCHGTGLAEVRSSIRTGGLREYAKVVLNSLRILREVPSYRSFAKVWTVSEEVQRQLLGYPYRVSRDRLEIISNGVDVDYFRYNESSRYQVRSELNIPANATVGITLSRLNLQKGVDLAISSLIESDGEDRFLIVAGDGPARNDLRRLSESLNVENRVKFVGHLEKARIPEYLSSADVMVFPTRRVEGLPLALLEALANGLPLVTTIGCNVPSDLIPAVTVSDTTGSAVALAWGAAYRTSLNRNESKLPERYSSDYMSMSYDQSIQHAIEHHRASGSGRGSK